MNQCWKAAVGALSGREIGRCSVEVVGERVADLVPLAKSLYKSDKGFDTFSKAWAEVQSRGERCDAK